MTDVAASTLSTVQTVQLALSVIQTLGLTQYQYPATCSATNGTYYDFIIIGGGSAGCVMANRLSANSNVSVLLIEAGGYAPLESDMLGVFPIIPSSAYDYNITSQNDTRTAQNLQNQCVELTAGKMLGGSSSLNHGIGTQGNCHDYDTWATMLNDQAWNCENIMPYMKKQENFTDTDILNSETGSQHGTSGPVKMARQHTSDNDNMIASAVEAGHEYKLDIPANSTLGICEAIIKNDPEGRVRQSSSVAYLKDTINRTNLCVLLETTATKILIKNNVAVGVQVVDSNGNVYVYYANKEVVVSAGAINSPKLLMLSGIGPKSHLTSFNIPVVADLPVGYNFHDHPSCVLVYQLESDSTTAAPLHPYTFAVPISTLYAAVNNSQTYPDYQAIFLLFPHDSSALVQLCSNSFKYSNDICNAWYAGSVNRNTVYVVFNLMMPKSRGRVQLASANYTDAPIVDHGIYSDSNGEDLTLMAKSLQDFSNITNTTTFKSLNGTLIDVGFCSGKTGYDYYECYALAMSAGMWHYLGSCAMGSVVDTNLTVYNVTNLRVADASVMPTQVSGNIENAVVMIAEKLSTLMLSDWNISVS